MELEEEEDPGYRELPIQGLHKTLFQTKDEYQAEMQYHSSAPPHQDAPERRAVQSESSPQQEELDEEGRSEAKGPTSGSSSDSLMGMEVGGKQSQEGDDAVSADGPTRFQFGELDFQSTFFPEWTEPIQGTAADMHGSLLALGTSIGYICLCDFGKELKQKDSDSQTAPLIQWKLFGAPVKFVKFDSTGEYIGVGSDSGELLILRVETGEIQYDGYEKRPAVTMGFASNFEGKKGHFVYSTEGGSFRFVEKKTFGADNVKRMTNRQQLVLDISWHDNLLAWVSATSINTLDMSKNKKLLYFDSLDTSIDVEICPPQILWFDSQTLIVCWDNTLMAFRFTTATSKEMTCEVSRIAQRQFPFHIASIARTGVDELAIVGYDPPGQHKDDSKNAEPDIFFASVSSRDRFRVLSFQRILGAPFVEDLPRDITLVSSFMTNDASADDPLIFIQGTRALIAVRYVTLLQKIEWYVQRGRLSRALQLALEQKDVSIETYFKLAMAYIDKLLGDGLFNQAIQCSNWLLYRCEGLRLVCSYSLLKAQGARGVDAAFSISGYDFANLPRSLMVMFLECWMFHQPLRFALMIVQWANTLKSSSSDKEGEAAVGEKLDINRLIVALKRCLRAREHALKRHRESKESCLSSATLEISVVPPELPSFSRFTRETDCFIEKKDEVYVECMDELLHVSTVLQFCSEQGCIKTGINSEGSQLAVRRRNQSTLLIETEHICEQRVGVLVRAMGELTLATGDALGALRTYVGLLDKYKRIECSHLYSMVCSLNWSENSEWNFGPKSIDYSTVERVEELEELDSARAVEIVAWFVSPRQVFSEEYIPTLAATDPAALAKSIRKSVAPEDISLLCSLIVPSSLLEKIHEEKSWKPLSSQLMEEKKLREERKKEVLLQPKLLQLLCIVHEICMDLDHGLNNFNGHVVSNGQKPTPVQDNLRMWHNLAFMLYLYYRPELAVGFLRRSALADVKFCLDLCRLAVDEDIEDGARGMKNHALQCRVELLQRMGMETMEEAISILWRDVQSVPQILDLINHASRATLQERQTLSRTCQTSSEFEEQSQKLQERVKYRHKSCMKILRKVAIDNFDPSLVKNLIKEVARDQSLDLIPLLQDILTNHSLPGVPSIVKDVLQECKEWESILSIAVDWMQKQEVINSFREYHCRVRKGYRFTPDTTAEEPKQRLRDFSSQETPELVLFACGHIYSASSLIGVNSEMQRQRSDSGMSTPTRQSSIDESTDDSEFRRRSFSSRRSRAESGISIIPWSGHLSEVGAPEDDNGTGRRRGNAWAGLKYICPKCQDHRYDGTLEI
eukprot:gb/GECG01008585.1/.p1 GENE.gb/GECG01008585.1/~~gb/GECG01008585.1/.p1  ORF type:complete len:1307 (+),score=173.18 gb/GECG01008585.1/:1-3921(+)